MYNKMRKYKNWQKNNIPSLPWDPVSLSLQWSWSRKVCVVNSEATAEIHPLRVAERSLQEQKAASDNAQLTSKKTTKEEYQTETKPWTVENKDHKAKINQTIEN